MLLFSGKGITKYKERKEYSSNDTEDS